MSNESKMDAALSAFFNRELDVVKARSYDVKHANLRARDFLPVSGEAGPGAESITYEQYDAVGIAKLISSYADDLPRADVKGAEFISPVKSLGASFGYSVQEVRASQMAGKGLEQRKANAARRSVAEAEDRIAQTGDASTGLGGFLNNANVTIVPAPTGTWTSATAPDDMLADMNALVSSIITATSGTESPDTLLLPVANYTLAAQTRVGDTNETVLSFFLRTNPWISNVDHWYPLATAGAGGVARAVAYKRDPDYVTLEIPQEFEMFAVQQMGLEFVTPVHERIGGVLIYYPIAMAYMDGM